MSASTHSDPKPNSQDNEILEETVSPKPDSPVLQSKKRSTNAERIGRGREYLAYLIGFVLLILVGVAGAGFLIGRNLEPLVPIIATIATLTGSVLAFYFASSTTDTKKEEE